MYANNIDLVLSTSNSYFITTAPEGSKANILSFLEEASSKILADLPKLEMFINVIIVVTSKFGIISELF